MKLNRLLLLIFFLSNTIFSLAQDTIYLKPYFRDLKTVDIIINGEKYNFLFDTGGGETFISPDIANLLNKEIYGCPTGIRMDGEMFKYQKADSVTLKISHTEIFHNTVGVWNIMDILPKELPKIDGILSLKSFVNKVLTIDLSDNILIIEDIISAKKQISTKELLPSRFASGPDGSELSVLIGLDKNNKTYWFLFDTGNIGPVIISSECKVPWKLQSTPADSANVSSGVELVMGKNKIEADAYSKNILYEGVLNFKSLSKYIFTIDLQKKEVWMN